MKMKTRTKDVEDEKQKTETTTTTNETLTVRKNCCVIFLWKKLDVYSVLYSVEKKKKLVSVTMHPFQIHT